MARSKVIPTSTQKESFMVNILRLFSSWKPGDGKNDASAPEDDENTQAAISPAETEENRTVEGNAADDSTFSSKESQEALKSVLRQSYENLAFLARDVNLPENVAARYTEGLFIREPGFMEASTRLGAPATTHRFGILSNHMKDIGSLDPLNRGLAVAQSGSRFKVLAKHSCKGKTLILLLHLPDENWQRLRQIRVNHFEEGLVKSHIAEFEKHCEMAVIPELDTEEWLERCEHPVGLDDKGCFFPPEHDDENEASEDPSGEKPSSLPVFAMMQEMADTLLREVEDSEWLIHSTLLLSDWIWENREKLTQNDLHRLLTVGAIILRNNPPAGH
jgi:hypothetical protein